MCGRTVSKRGSRNIVNLKKKKFLFKNEPSCTCATVQKYFAPQTVPYPEIFREYQFQLEILEQDPKRTNPVGIYLLKVNNLNTLEQNVKYVQS